MFNFAQQQIQQL